MFHVKLHFTHIINGIRQPHRPSTNGCQPTNLPRLKNCGNGTTRNGKTNGSAEGPLTDEVAMQIPVPRELPTTTNQYSITPTLGPNAGWQGPPNSRHQVLKVPASSSPCSNTKQGNGDDKKTRRERELTYQSIDPD